MKKIILMLIGLIITLFIPIFFIIINDSNNTHALKNNILENTDINIIKYINYYDGYYIIKDNDSLYLFDGEYNEILSISLSLLFNNYKNYDIVYRNKTLMYMDNYKNEEGLIFKYYDIYTGDCIDEIIVR